MRWQASHAVPGSSCVFPFAPPAGFQQVKATPFSYKRWPVPVRRRFRRPPFGKSGESPVTPASRSVAGRSPRLARMGKIKRVVALFGAAVLGAIALSGCTPFVSDAVRSPTVLPIVTTKAAPSEASIFEGQRATVENSPTPGRVLTQYQGIGPTTLKVGPLPEGQKSIGVTVSCSGSDDWKVTFTGKKHPGWGSSGCSMDVGNTVSYPVDDPSKEQTVDVSVSDGVRVWVTLFSTT